MLARSVIVAFGLAAAFPAAAQEMTPVQAQRFVYGKTFSYSCFDGTRGAGRIHPDGSVQGTVQMGGKGVTKVAVLPANTLRVKGEKVCASVKGVLFEPCFNLQQTGDRSFRGTIAGLSFAYCDFRRGGGGGRGRLLRTATRERGKPLALRSTLAE
jgi:hypothetical protein